MSAGAVDAPRGSSPGDDLGGIDWAKGLIPAVVQDAVSGEVLMLGYMNEEALAATRATGRVTFFSRRRQRLWVKGETSGNFLTFKAASIDCDGDALLILATPSGPVCHRGTRTCFGDVPRPAAAGFAFLAELEGVIAARAAGAQPGAASYTARLLAARPRGAAQKLGEEAVELALAAVAETDERVVEEAADLMYHLLVLLRSRGLTLGQVARVLEGRRRGFVSG